MTETMTETYTGPVRVLLTDGAVLTTGQAQLEPDPETGSWRGTLQVLRGTAVAGKALVVDIEIPGGGKGRAQLVPVGEQGDRSYSKVIGLGSRPF
ncbi:MAG: hypothetical protein DIU67_006870 [Actinomycetes bacterium]|jgi:hypothetical protein|nr:MAG: hypothetical protein DIU67_00150 [Actinomycetota bacterium]